MNNMTQQDELLPPIFDTREALLLKTVDQMKLPYRVDQLLIGDIAISDRVIVERKAIYGAANDLRASLFDGNDRIHVQAKDRAEKYPINIIILEIGADSPVTDYYFDDQRCRSLLLTMELSFNSHIHITHSAKETIELIYSLWEHEKKGVKVVSATNKQPRPKLLREQQIYFLSGLIELGDVKTLQLLSYFQNPYRVIQWLLMTKIEYTKSGNPKSPDLPETLKGFGPQFFLKNQQLLLKKE